MESAQVKAAMQLLYEQVASVNCGPAHGKMLNELIPDYAEAVLQALRGPNAKDARQEMLSWLERCAATNSYGIFGMEQGDATNFSPELATSLQSALLIARGRKRERGAAFDRLSNFAILADGSVVTVNEGYRKETLNPWPPLQ